MAKKTWINVGGVFRNVKNVWLNVNGVWKQKVIPKGNIGGLLKEFIQYSFLLYNYGVEHVPISRASNYSATSYEERVDSIYSAIRGDTMNTPLAFILTDGLIDVTNYNTLAVTWSLGGWSHSNNEAFIILKNQRFSNYTGQVARANFTNTFTEREDVLDISALTGSYYVGVGHQVDSEDYRDRSYLTIKKIELR